MYISLTVFLLASSVAMSQHLPSITKMPDFPPNYEMRDWKKTARDFDFLVFDSKRNGDFLPLIWTDKSRKVNDFEGFAIPSYVGDLRQNAKTKLHNAKIGGGRNPPREIIPRRITTFASEGFKQN